MNKATNIEKTAKDISDSNSRQLWCNYAWTIRNYVVSCLGDLPDTAIGKGWVIDSIYAISSDTEKKYGDAASLKMIHLLYGMFTLISDKALALKEGYTIEGLSALDMAAVSSLTEFLYHLNSSKNFEKWMIDVELAFNLMTNQVVARVAQEWHREFEYQSAILEIFTGIADDLSAPNTRSSKPNSIGVT